MTASPQQTVKARADTVFRSETGSIPSIMGKIASRLTLGPMKAAPFADRRMIYICMTPRSGSTYLGSLFQANGLAKAQEHFRIVGGSLERDVALYAVSSYEEYFRRKVKKLTSASGLFVAKCDWPQYLPLYMSGIHAHYMRDAAYIYLTRSDILGQAISRYVATETNYFHSTNVEYADALREEVPFDYAGIREHLERLICMQGDWERFFASEGIAPYRLTYEQIERSPTSVMTGVAASLGLTLPSPIVTETDFKTVRTAQNDRLRALFLEEHDRRMADAPWRGAGECP